VRLEGEFFEKFEITIFWMGLTVSMYIVEYVRDKTAHWTVGSLSGGGVFALLMYNLRRRFGHWIHGIFQVADFVWPYLAVSTTDASLTQCR
jgi:hypothetical protein